MKKLTVKNSKAEFMEAYNELLEKMNELEKQKDNTAKITTQKEETKIIENAETIIDLNILNPTVTEQYNDLKKAIELKKVELKELYDIDKEANTLLALLNAYKDKEVELEDSYKELTLKKKQELEDYKVEVQRELDKLKKDMQEKKKEMLDSFNKEKAENELQRKREEEEYDYDLNRKRKIEDDLWEEEKTKKLKALNEREEEVVKKEEEYSKKETELNELKEKVDNIPNLVEEAKKEGATAKEKELGKEYGYNKYKYEERLLILIDSSVNSLRIIKWCLFGAFFNLEPISYF